MATIELAEGIELSTIPDFDRVSQVGSSSDIHAPQRPSVNHMQTIEARTASADIATSPPAPDDIPDGGYGWVIVASCAIISFFWGGLTYSWGIVQAHLSASHLGKDASLAFVGSTASAFVAFTAIMNARLIRLLGTRTSTLVGCFLLGLGQLLNSWTLGSVGGLVVTNGIIGGLGVSMCFMACGSLPSQYFKKRRGLANGIVFAGAGLGGAVISIGLDALIARVGLAWAFRILGLATMAMTMPAAMFIRERSRRAAASVEWGLFRDPKFILLFFGTGIATFPLLVPPFFIPLYAQSLGASSALASILLGIFNLASAAGRIGFGLLGDKVGPISSLLLALVISAVSMLVIWPVSARIAPLIVFIAMSGLGNGGFFSTIPSVVGHVYGPTRLANALAMVVSGWAFGYFLGSPIAGWLLQAYGGSSAGRAAFRPAIYFAGSLAVASAGLVITMRQLAARRVFAFA